MHETAENRMFIIEEMSALRKIRQDMIGSGCTINAVLEKFPKLLSYQGAVVSNLYHFAQFSFIFHHLKFYVFTSLLHCIVHHCWIKLYEIVPDCFAVQSAI